MMYRSNWAQKKNQDRILAIFITREGFDEILRYSKGNQSGIKHETSHMPGRVDVEACCVKNRSETETYVSRDLRSC